MECNKCGWAMPMDAELHGADCIVCDGKIRYSADEYLEYPELGLVKETRGAQIDLAKIITQGIREKREVIVEAGTGVGKSFAYLVPALMSGKRVVVSTAKKTLQTQLIEKDLPYLNKKLNIGDDDTLYARAYGKSNFVCKKAAEDKKGNKTKFKGPIVKEFFNDTEHGLWEEIPEIIHNSQYTKRELQVFGKGIVQLSAENCEGSKCEHYERCHYITARRKVNEAKIVVANHWLTGIDLMLRKRESYEYFGEYSVLIVDEAHKFEDGVRSAFTQEIKQGELKRLTDILTHKYEDLPANEKLAGTDYAIPNEHQLHVHWSDMFKQVGRSTGEMSIATLGTHGGSLAQELTIAIKHLSGPRNIAQLFPTMGSVNIGVVRDKLFMAPGDPNRPSDHAYGKAVAGLTDSQRTFLRHLRAVTEKFVEINQTLNTIYSDDENNVVYVEDTGFYKAIKVAPVELHSLLNPYYKNITPVFASATLAVGGSLKHASRRFGLFNKNKLQAQYGSAFNYAKQAILYVSRQTTDRTDSPEYITSLAKEIYDLTNASQGNAFVLFTATSEMNGVAAELMNMGYSLPLVVQSGPASEALKTYNNTKNAVLFGLKSFWEGVDVPGNKLELVIVAKLPFPLRGDPVIQAKCKKAGDRWFSEVYIPEMILDLRQGVGRLIRSKTDRGVVAILDARLEKRKYTKTVLNSLGFSQVTANKQTVERALGNLASHRT